MKASLIAVSLLLLTTGCAALRDHILVNTETVVGLGICQNQASGLYEARLGYVRHELALLPTNEVNILTEMQVKNIFSISSGPSFYQRLAIGKEAVKCSVYMFIKNPDGTVNPEALKAVHSAKQD